MLMTGEQYIESLRKLNTRVYMFGEKIDNWVDHPIIRPSINPTIDLGDKFERPSFGIKVSTTQIGVAGLYLKGGDYWRNYQIEHTMDGPIYVIEDVEIVMGEVFPNLDKNKTQVAVEQWTNLKPYNQDVKVSGYSQTFTLKETANYLNPDPDGKGGEKGVPPYSYYINKGKWRFTETGFDTTKGLFTYLQLIDKNENKPLNMPFLDRGLYFEPVEDPNGIVDVNDDIQPDDTIEVYDLMGRKVKRTGKGIYIMKKSELHCQLRFFLIRSYLLANRQTVSFASPSDTKQATSP